MNVYNMCTMICKSKQAASLVNCCIIMVFETVESIDIPPPQIPTVLLCFVPDNSIKKAPFPAGSAPVISAGCDSSSPREDH